MTRLQVTTPDALPEESSADAALRPSRLDEFVGQDQVKASLQIAIDAAKRRRRDHSTTPSSSARPDSARRRSPCSWRARWVSSSERLPDRCSRSPAISSVSSPHSGPGDILFIDEIHRLRPTLEEFLYPAMEDFRVDVRISDGPNAQTIPMTLERFTLVGATTRFGLLTPPMRARFGLVERLGFYPADELEQIVDSVRGDSPCADRGRRARARLPVAAAGHRGSRIDCCDESATTRR